MKTFEKQINAFNIKYNKKKQLFFKKYNSELIKKKITEVSEINKFWNKSYKAKFDNMIKKMNDEYAKIYHQHH